MYAVVFPHLGFEDLQKIPVENVRKVRYPNSFPQLFFFSILLCEKCFNPLSAAVVCGRRSEE